MLPAEAHCRPLKAIHRPLLRSSGLSSRQMSRQRSIHPTYEYVVIVANDDGLFCARRAIDVYTVRTGHRHKPFLACNSYIAALPPWLAACLGEKKNR
jgi:hypothetical protein